MKRKNRLSFRILSLVILSVLLSTLVTLAVYSVIMPRAFTMAKIQELYPSAQYLADQASLLFSAGYHEASAAILGVDTRPWGGAAVWILDKKGDVITSTESSLGNPYYNQNKTSFQNLLVDITTETEVNYIQQMQATEDGSGRAVKLLVIGVPILVEKRAEGAVVMIKSQEEINAAMSSLTTTLSMSILAALCAMVPMAYFLARFTTKPIRQMHEVALRMATGDFSVRAPVRDKGEVGDLGRAFNLLSEQLGSTIADLTQERNKAMVIVNNLDEGLLSVDKDRNPIQTNPAMEALLSAHGGLPAFPPEVMDAFRATIEEREPNYLSFPLGNRVLNLTVNPIGEGKTGAVSAIGVFRDETEAARLEQTRREYVANVSHELRTPLTAMRALIEPLRDGLIRTDEKRQDTYNIILRETMRLSRLVDDMLELSRLQSGGMALEKIRFQLEPLLRDTASIYSAKAKTTGHELVLELPEKQPPTVMCSPDRTEQVLVGLLNNAFTYTPSGSRIVIRLVPEAQWARVIVEDDGPGIRPEDLPHVFERFYKADKSRGSSSGTGLGLAIAWELLRLLGETISVENKPEGGARFSFTLHYQDQASGPPESP